MSNGDSQREQLAALTQSSSEGGLGEYFPILEALENNEDSNHVDKVARRYFRESTQNINKVQQLFGSCGSNPEEIDLVALETALDRLKVCSASLTAFKPWKLAVSTWELWSQRKYQEAMECFEQFKREQATVERKFSWYFEMQQLANSVKKEDGPVEHGVHPSESPGHTDSLTPVEQSGTSESVKNTCAFESAKDTGSTSESAKNTGSTSESTEDTGTSKSAEDIGTSKSAEQNDTYESTEDNGSYESAENSGTSESTKQNDTYEPAKNNGIAENNGSYESVGIAENNDTYESTENNSTSESAENAYIFESAENAYTSGSTEQSGTYASVENNGTYASTENNVTYESAENTRTSGSVENNSASESVENNSASKSVENIDTSESTKQNDT